MPPLEAATARCWGPWFAEAPASAPTPDEWDPIWGPSGRALALPGKSEPIVPREIMRDPWASVKETEGLTRRRITP